MVLTKYIRQLKRLDWLLLVTTLFLVFIGLLAIYAVNLGAENASFLNFKKQLVFSAIGFTLFFVFTLFDYRTFHNYSRVLYLLGVGLLVGVLLFGRVIRGTKGWFVVGNLTFQPVELVKLILVIFLGHYFSRWGRQLDNLKYIFISGFYTFILFFLVLMQPDFGSALIIFLVWFLLLIIIGIKRRYLVALLIIMVSLGFVAWGFYLKDYQKNRVLSFINPAHDPQGSGYNITQSIIAIGSGGFFGRGLGFGSQTQLKFLPESQNDFIFAVIAEELGFLGISVVLGLYVLLLYRILSIAYQTRDDFSLIICLGVFSVLFIHIFINIAMNLGMFPIMGISLPLLSYGGSFLVVVLSMIGLVEGIHIRSKLNQE